jgi:hypothetical protein
VEALEGSRPKKRKNGEGLNIHGREDHRSSVKRPRHSVSGPEMISGSEFPHVVIALYMLCLLTDARTGGSKSGQTSFGSATDPGMNVTRLVDSCWA